MEDKGADDKKPDKEQDQESTSLVNTVKKSPSVANDKRDLEKKEDEKADSEKASKSGTDEEKDKVDSGCVDTEELRLMIIQKSPSVVKCEQDELQQREVILLIWTFIAMTFAFTVVIIIVGAMRDKNKCLAKLDNITEQLIMYRDNPQFCTNKDCMQISSQISQSRLGGGDDACKDLYSYACGDWSRIHPHAASTWTVDLEHQKRIKLKIVRKLQTPPNDASTSLRRAKNLFKSCMNTEALDAGGDAVLWEAVDAVGGWNLKGK